MLTRLRSRLRHPFEEKNATDGFTLIEVVVAMFVFMIVSLGILSGVMLTRIVSSDAQARQTASNLATAAINVARTTQDLNDLGSSTTTRTVAGRTYTVKTTALWAPSTTGVTTQCSTGSGAVLGKSVRVAVTWNGHSGVSTPVTQTTLVASSSAVTQVGNGSIMVQVSNSQGQPFSAGIALTIAVVSGGATPDPSEVPSTVDGQGCAFIPNLVPGTYNVTIGTTYSGTGDPFVDTRNQPQSTQPITVTANTMTAAGFTYDTSTPVAVTFSGVAGALVPAGITATFVHDGTISTPANGCLGLAADYCVFPYPTGYSIVAGNLGAGTAPSCESVDPTQWQATPGYAQGTATPVVTTAGTPTAVTIPMGAVALTGLDTLTGSGALTISAVQQGSGMAGSADPGCAAATTPATAASYSFPIAASTAAATLALPFGSWVLTYTTTATTTSTGNATCTNSGSSCSPTLPTGASWTASATCTHSGSWPYTYSCSRAWQNTISTTSAAQSLAGHITAPTAPGSYQAPVAPSVSAIVTLDPRQAVSTP